MAESQSRYSIMEELNNRKINQREKLANLEKDKDSNEYERGKETAEIEEEIVAQEKSYKIEYKDRQRQRKVQLDLITSEFERTKKQIEEDIKDDKGNYESRFQKWKTQQKDNIKTIKDTLKRYIEIQIKKIETKKTVISEIEAGITSLKEMSAEQKEN